MKQNWLGYSKNGNRGSGLGKDFAEALNRNLNTVLKNFGDEAITKSSHLEKLCLIKDGVGRDRISDFTTNLIKDFLLSYTERYALEYLSPSVRKKTSVSKARFNYGTKRWDSRVYDLPFYNDDFVLLTPRDLLTKDDTWINREDLIEDFDEISESISNNELRAQINNYFLQLLPKEADKEDVRSAVARVIDKFPEVLDYYIKYKEDDGEAAETISEKKGCGIRAVVHPSS